MRFSGLISCLFFLLSSCAFKPIQGFKAEEEKTDPIPQVFNMNLGDKVLFKSGLDFKDQHFSGLLLVKKMEDSNFRAVFTTEMGLKMFDLEMSTSANTWHHCFDQLNRPMVLETIESDLGLLFNASNNQEAIWLRKGDEHCAQQIFSKGRAFWFLRKENNQVSNLYWLEGRNKLKTQMKFEGNEETTDVYIHHPKSGLDLHLRKLEN